MIRNLLKAGALFSMMFLASCFGQHNYAPNTPEEAATEIGVNLDDERIYGPSREAPPKQLSNEYEPEDKARINNIREKMFPN